MLAILLTLSGFAPLDSLPETVQITGPDTTVGGYPVNLTFCATGLMPNSVSQWNSSVWAFSTGPYPPYNNPGSCQNFNFYLLPSWVPINPVISCTNYAGSASFSTWIIPMNSAQEFNSLSATTNTCETTQLTATSTSSWYRPDYPDAFILPHRWQYRDASTGTWVNFAEYPLTVIPYSALPTAPAQRVTATTDTLFGTLVVDSTNYDDGTSELHFLSPLSHALHGLRVRKVLDRFQGNSVTSDSASLRALASTTILNYTGPDSVVVGDSSLFWVPPVAGVTSHTWWISGGTLWPNASNDSALVRWDSLGTAQVSVTSFTAPLCSSSASHNFRVARPPVLFNDVRNLNLADPSSEPRWTVWPSPSTGPVWMAARAGTTAQMVWITDAAGRLVRTIPLRAEPQQVELPLGVYFIRDERGTSVPLAIMP